MLDSAILLPAILNGLTIGAIYALIALGLTLIYGVLHIINFAHGSLLMLALYGAFFLKTLAGIDPYLALPILVPAFFALGYALHRGVIEPASHGREHNVLMVTLGLAIIIDNLALYFWTSTTRAVAKEREGARLAGIRVAQVYAVSFGIGTACVAAAACLLLPTFYVTPQVGYAFVLVAFTTVVLGGMGSFVGALVGGLALGVVEALSGLLLGESLGQIGIFVIFILVLLLRPTGLFGSRLA